MAAQIANSICCISCSHSRNRSESRVKLVGGKPQWKVTVSNQCHCKQSNIKVLCKGFQSTEPVDRNILNLQGETCLFPNGNPLVKGSPVTFYYAWETPFSLYPLSSKITCS